MLVTVSRSALDLTAVHRDPTFYPDFKAFRPERFSDESDPVASVNRHTHDIGHASYGYGRR